MKKIFSIVAVCSVVLCSCSSVNKHKISTDIHTDSTTHDSASLVNVKQATLKAKAVTADTSTKSGVEVTNTRTETTYQFIEIPADAVLNNTAGADYFNASYKTKDGKQFVAVPAKKTDQQQSRTWNENTGSKKTLETELQKHDSSSAIAVKNTKATTDITIKESTKKKIQFSFWWIVLVVAAGFVWYYRKPIFKAVKKVLPI